MPTASGCFSGDSVWPRSPGTWDFPASISIRSRGARQGTWAVRVSGNWRLTFRFEGPDVSDVNYEDYH